MTRTQSYHLFDMLAEVPDPRKKKGHRYPLKSILGLIEVGLLCGHKGYTPIATWARTQPALTKALGFRNGKTPCAAALHNVLKKLDTLKLEQVLMPWTTAVYQSARFWRTP